MKPIRLLILLLLLAIVGNAYPAGKPITIHSTNFYLPGLDKDVFYPKAINADFLMNPDIAPEYINKTFETWTQKGINTIRIRVDSMHAPDDPLDLYQSSDGQLKPVIIARLDALIESAEKHNLYIVLVLFDLQRLGANWDKSPYNTANGGSCAKLSDWFNQPTQVSLSLNRTEQLVNRYAEHNIFAWEIGRGSNVWDLSKRPNNKLMESVPYWLIRHANLILKIDNPRHLLALSFLPNTYPDTLLGLPHFQMHFIQIEAQNTLQTAMSVAPYLNSIREKFKKPVFVVEHNWKGNPAEREEFVHNLFWSSFAACSGMFLSPVQTKGQYQVADYDLRQIQVLDFFLPQLKLNGAPRQITVPIKISQEDSYLIVESLIGYDRFFWLLRKSPSQDKAILNLMTVEGKYQKQWFDIDAMRKFPIQDFTLLRKSLMIESVPFERSVFGVLRLIKRAPKKAKPPVSQPAAGVN